MQLDSYLEIFTTFYGWAFANIIGEIIVGTGLAVLPFGVIVFNAWREAREQGISHGGVLGLIESVSTKLIVAMFVMSLCFATSPITSLHKLNLSYTPPDTYDGSPPVTGSSQGGTASGFDTGMADALTGSFSRAGNLSYVPAWWFSVMAISSGMNNAFRNGLNNAGRDFRVLEDMARNATIEDSALLHEVQRFYSECFVPARSQYMAMNKANISASGLAILDKDNTAYGPTDVDWMGSQFMRTEPGFYDSRRSYNPVPGWAIDFSRDTDYIQTPADPGSPEANYVNPDWGRPTCKQWWEDSSMGLREKMVSQSSTWTNLTNKTVTVLSSSPLGVVSALDQSKDEVAKLAQLKANPVFVNADRILGNHQNTTDQVLRTIGGGISTIGTGMMAAVSTVAYTPLVTGLPMMQALVLMAMYMFLPLLTFLSGYDLKVMFLGAIAIFTVKFWAVMWTVAQWVDAKLIESMYPGSGSNIFVQEITMIASGSVPPTYKRMVLNVLLVGMFIGLPIIWTGMMTWIGIRVGDGLNMLVNKSGDGLNKSAQSSTSLVSKGKAK